MHWEKKLLGVMGGMGVRTFLFVWECKNKAEKRPDLFFRDGPSSRLTWAPRPVMLRVLIDDGTGLFAPPRLYCCR